MCWFAWAGYVVLLGFAGFGALCTYWLIDEYRGDRQSLVRWNRKAGRWEHKSK